MKIEKEMFKDSHFLMAQEKYQIAKHFQRFVKNGFKPNDFLKRVYEHLHLHCGFIAHYNINGFYQTYFNGSKSDLRTFAEHFVNPEKLMPFGDTYNNYAVSGEYEDINKVIADILLENNILEMIQNEN